MSRGVACIGVLLLFIPSAVAEFVLAPTIVVPSSDKAPPEPQKPHAAKLHLEETELAQHPFWVFQADEVMRWETVFGCLALFVSGILCSAAGIGGGGIYVAVLLVVGRLSPHDAVPLSKAIVFFGAVSSLIVNLRRAQSSHGEKSVIDLHACRIVVPCALIGTSLGVLMNFHTGGFTIVVLLNVLLFFTTFLVLREALKQRQEEEAGVQHQVASDSNGSVEVLQNPQDDSDGPEEGRPLIAASSDRAAQELRKQNQPTSFDVIIGGWLLLCVVLGSVLRFHMKRCQDEHEGLTHRTGYCQHPVAATLLGGNMELWMKETATARILQAMTLSLPIWSCLVIAFYYANLAHSDGKWTVPNIAAYQAVAVLTGILAGLVGVGGGLVFAPFFLLTGMEPAIAVGTSSTCVLFTSWSTTLQYAFTDRIIMSLALAYGMTCLVASYAGTSLVHFLQDSFSGRRSYITLIVAVGVALSAALTMCKLISLLQA